MTTAAADGNPSQDVTLWTAKVVPGFEASPQPGSQRLQLPLLKRRHQFGFDASTAAAAAITGNAAAARTFHTTFIVETLAFGVTALLGVVPIGSDSLRSFGDSLGQLVH